jgi:hypothetical protein
LWLFAGLPGDSGSISRGKGCKKLFFLCLDLFTAGLAGGFLVSLKLDAAFIAGASLTVDIGDLWAKLHSVLSVPVASFALSPFHASPPHTASR